MHRKAFQGAAVEEFQGQWQSSGWGVLGGYQGHLFQDKLTGQGERCSGNKCTNVWKQKSRFYAYGNGIIRVKSKPIKPEPGPGKKGHGNVVDIHVTAQVLSDQTKGFVSDIIIVDEFWKQKGKAGQEE